MLAVLQLIGAFVADLFKSRRRLEIENLSLPKTPAANQNAIAA